MYDGPLKVPNKRAKKDPLAPKRAMSAFLHFSQSMRPRLRETYPEAKNMDMSKMLGQVRRGGGRGQRTERTENREAAGFVRDRDEACACAAGFLFFCGGAGGE